MIITRVLKLPGFMMLLAAMPISLGGQIVDGDQIYHVLPKDAISAILDPEIVGIDEGGIFMADEEQVLGVVGPNGTAVAYSTWYLDAHEIVNDVVDGVPLAVTW